MKKNTILGGVLAAFLMVLSFGVLLGAPDEALAKNGNAWGHYKSSGNSAFGRSHNQNAYYNYQYRYVWDGRSFDNFDDFVDYLRDWIENRDHGYNDSDDNEVDIDITTRDATDIDDDTATLEGTIDFNDSDKATVWFEYGPDADLKWRTTKVRVTDGNTEEFARVLIGLEDDQKYSFRAVGEDEDGDKEYGSIKTFTTDDNGNGSANDEDPSVTTLSAQDVEDDSVTLRGTIDMNDFDNGRVFFVYGEDEDMIEDVEDDFDTYDEIDEDGDDLRKVLVDSDLDGSATFTRSVTGLDADTDIHYAIGVEYENEDGDDVIKLGSVKSFTTDN